MSPLERIRERVGRHGDVNDPETRRPLLTLEEFFEGNDSWGSIWCNLEATPGPAEIFEILAAIAPDLRSRTFAWRLRNSTTRSGPSATRRG